MVPQPGQVAPRLQEDVLDQILSIAARPVVPGDAGHEAAVSIDEDTVGRGVAGQRLLDEELVSCLLAHGVGGVGVSSVQMRELSICTGIIREMTDNAVAGGEESHDG